MMERPNKIFGKRFIKIKKLEQYAVDLNLCSKRCFPALVEFLERNEMLTPVRRINLPAKIIRHLEKKNYPSLNINLPIESNKKRISAAEELMNALNTTLWEMQGRSGNHLHVLDAMKPEHCPFIKNNFPRNSFRPWKKLRKHIYDTNSGPIYSSVNLYAPSYYHYWQIFWLSTILRTGFQIVYPIGENDVTTKYSGIQLIHEALKGDYQSLGNSSARDEFLKLNEFREHFETVGYFIAYCQNSFTRFAYNSNEYGVIPKKDQKEYWDCEREIALEAFYNSSLSKDDLIEFIKQQCKWWENSRRNGPVAIATEYKHNINYSIKLVRLACNGRPQHIVKKVGCLMGYSRPILEIIFLDWIEELRDLTFRSLKGWVDEYIVNFPEEFQFSDDDLREFCNWIEEKNFFQYYVHFGKFLELQQSNDPIFQTTSTSEVVGFAILCEMIVNESIKDLGGEELKATLKQKLPDLLKSRVLENLFRPYNKLSKLTGSSKDTLLKRLALIKKIPKNKVGIYTPILCAIHSFVLIRNKGAHLGLLELRRGQIFEMIRIISIASIMIWKIRSIRLERKDYI